MISLLGHILILTSNLMDISQCRQVYMSQNKERVISMLDILSNNDNLTTDELCYKSVSECMKAEYVLNPYQKLSYFNSGYNTLNAIIEEYQSNVEYRYHRYMIEKHAPSWLIEESHKQIDKDFINNTISKKHPMYSFIMETMNN